MGWSSIKLVMALSSVSSSAGSGRSAKLRGGGGAVCVWGGGGGGVTWTRLKKELLTRELGLQASLLLSAGPYTMLFVLAHHACYSI